MAKGRKKRSSEKEEAPYTFSDEATQKKIHKHITDIKDVITEQDIANVKVPGEEDEEPNPVPPTEEADKNKDEEKGKLAGEGKPITPWDVID